MKLSLIVFGVIIGIIVIEFAARLLLDPPYRGGKGRFNIRCDQMMGWRGEPFWTETLTSNGYEHQLVQNSRGMHDGEHTFEKDDNVFRILMLGDSFMEAIQVNEVETAHQVLEQNLNEILIPEMTAEVISAGIGGWGPAQELMYFRTEGKHYKPDLVLMMWFIGNDLADNLPDYRRTSFAGINCYAPYFAICDGQSDPEPWFSVPGLSPTLRQCSAIKKAATVILSWLYANSRIYQSLEPRLGHTQIQKTYPNLYSPWVEAEAGDETLEYAYQVNAQVISLLASETAEAGGEFILVIVPPKEAVFLEANPDFSDLPDFIPEGTFLNPVLPNQRLISSINIQEIPVLDLQPYLVDDFLKTGKSKYGSQDFHLSLDGNRFVAQTLTEWLVENNFAPAQVSDK